MFPFFHVSLSLFLYSIFFALSYLFFLFPKVSVGADITIFLVSFHS
jgi:hypothetical protein